MRRRFDPWLALSLLILAGFTVQGAWNGFTDLPDATSRLQFIACISQIAYGALAFLAIPALLIGWRGLRPLLHLWVTAVTLTGGLAPVAWGGATLGAGIAAMILSCVIALAVIWVIRRAQVVP
jgi:hypothetical protein